MRHLPIHWTEGMFLRPHHFQAADRYWSEQLQTLTFWDHQFGYGLRSLEFSREALANGQFQVHRLQARMADGTLVDLDTGQEPDRMDLKGPLADLENALIDLQEAFVSASKVRVYLGVPKLQMGQANVDNDGDNGHTRFLTLTRPIQDESAGGNDQEIQLRSLNVRLLLSTQDLAGYELLPIAQIERAGEGEAVPRVDEQYVPPLLACDAWSGLRMGIIRPIYDIVGKKIEVLSQQVVNRGVTLEGQEPGDFDRIIMLQQLNEAYATLQILAFAPGVHPFTVYTELARLVGKLSIFGPDRRVPELPRYDHEDLGPIFLFMRRMVEQQIDVVRDFEYEQRFFVGSGLGMQVALEAKWFNADWQWFVGVHKGDLNEQECRDVLSPGHLDWKLGSARQVELLFKQGIEGLQLVPTTRNPRALPRSQDWVYYEVTRGNAAWRDVQSTQSLAMRLKDALILNLDHLQGQRKLVVKNPFGREATIQFALFAVPMH